MSSTNYRLTGAYTRYILMQEKQYISPTTPSTGLKCRVSISPVYIWYTLIIYIVRPHPLK